MGFGICPYCTGTGSDRKIVCKNKDLPIKAVVETHFCEHCSGTGFIKREETYFDKLREDRFFLGAYLAKMIPSHACPKKVREIWYSYPPGDMKAYEKAWQDWLDLPGEEKLV